MAAGLDGAASKNIKNFGCSVTFSAILLVKTTQGFGMRLVSSI
jgi:hypothetical protein